MKKTEQIIELDGRVINEGEFNQKAMQWTLSVKNVFKANIKGKMSSKQTGELLSSVRSRISKQGGMLNQIGFDFHRYGVFMAYGVGRGYVHTPGGVIRGMRPDSHRKSHGIEGKGQFTAYGSGPLRRKPIDWFDSELPENVEKLADLIVEYYGDMYLINNDTVSRLSIAK